MKTKKRRKKERDQGTFSGVELLGNNNNAIRKYKIWLEMSITMAWEAPKLLTYSKYVKF